MDPFLGEIRPAGFGFAPLGWALCQGQILSISQNTALFSLLGTNFGGNGQTNFALPDLRSRIPIGVDTAGTYVLGEQNGVETVTLDNSTMPAHPHGTIASTAPATDLSPVGLLPAVSALNWYAPNPKGQVFGPQITTMAGNSQSHSNIQPYTTINYMIALVGIFPQRP